jgi:hypothetical protein
MSMLARAPVFRQAARSATLASRRSMASEATGQIRAEKVS